MLDGSMAIVTVRPARYVDLGSRAHRAFPPGRLLGGRLPPRSAQVPLGHSIASGLCRTAARDFLIAVVART